ncbi:MAG TPA: ABC transporter ATP-binding protein [Candidatus Dormibacteraeota bacterium]|nr:ABC transporter ATP-binding protein [Candidatus Dormibacteraeota bacterium]
MNQAAATGADAGHPGSLEVRSLGVRFGGVVALDGVSLGVPAGRIIGIIGPNGAGKTTLFNGVCGLVSPTAGEVVYNGRRVNGIRPHELNGLGISRTLQGLGLWRALTVLENVMVGARRGSTPGFASAILGLPRSDRYENALKAEVMDQLRELGIEDSANRYPGTLPYGVQKWVALARALVSRPALLLLDEPASGLSANEQKQLVTLLRSLRDRMSIALVEHRLDLVMTVCEHIHVLDFGRLIASGSPEEVQNNKAVTDAYLGTELLDARIAHEEGTC